MARSLNIKAPIAVVSYTNDLFKPREQDNGAKGYGVTLIYSKSVDISELESLAVATAVEEWGDKAKQWIKDGVIKSPFLDGDGKQGKDKSGNQRAELQSARFIRCKSGLDYKPAVFDRQRNPVLTVEGCPSGSKGYPVINCFTWDNPSNGKGLSFGISMLQVTHVATGSEVLGGGVGDPNDYFESLDDEGDAPGETRDGKGATGLFG